MNIGYSKNMQARNDSSEEKYYDGSSHATTTFSSQGGGGGGVPIGGTLHQHLSSSIDAGIVIDDPMKLSPVKTDLVLAVRKQPPSHLFPKQEFEIEYGYDRSDSVTDQIPFRYVQEIENYKILATLYRSDPKTGTRKLVTMEQGGITILAHRRDSSSNNGTLLCRIDLNVETQNYDTKNQIDLFCVRLSCSNLSGHESDMTIGDVITRSISIAPFKLVVSKTSAWENVWFKEEGGRDKCIEISVHAENEKEEMLHQNIKLKLTLCYDSSNNKKGTNGDPTVVNNQSEMLKVLGRAASRQHIDQESGKGKIRFRIEDVSRNHQGQNFVLKLETEGFLNVSPGYTSPITVKSKRTRMQRRSIGDIQHGSDHSATGQPMSPNVPGGPWKTSQMYPIHETQRRETTPPVFAPTFDPIRLQQAYSGVVQWVDDVVAGLYNVQWKVVGYAQHMDGSPDYTRPYHNMTNPNIFINKMLAMYNDSTRKQLRHIGDAIEHNVQKTPSPISPPVLHPSHPPPHETFEHDPVRYPAYETTTGRMPPPQGSYPPPLPFDYPPSQQSQPYHHHHHPPPFRRSISPRTSSMMATGGNISQSLSSPPPSQYQMTQRDSSTGGYSHESQQQQQHSYSRTHPPPYSSNVPYQPHHAGGGSGSSPHRHVTTEYGGGGGGDPMSSKMHHHMYDRYSPSTEDLMANKRLKKDTQQEQQPHSTTTQLSQQRQSDLVESDVEYVLAKNHKSMRTGERLGFPAFDVRKNIIGFYRSFSGIGTNAPLKFVIVSTDTTATKTTQTTSFSQDECIQAKQLLESEITMNSEAVHRIHDWGSIGTMLNNCIVYEWKSELGEDTTTTTDSTNHYHRSRHNSTNTKTTGEK